MVALWWLLSRFYLSLIFSSLTVVSLVFFWILWRKLSTEELMLLNCGVGEDSWESLGLQGDPTSPFWRISALGFLWKEWYSSWNSSTLATSCEELTHWKRLWCWEGLGAGKEGDNRGWDDWMASLTQWTWVSVYSGSWWWAGRPGVLRIRGSRRVGHDWSTDLIWLFPKAHLTLHFRMFSLRWITTPSLFSGSLRAFLYSSSIYFYNHFAIYLKLAQHCKSLQLKKNQTPKIISLNILSVTIPTFPLPGRVK